VKELKCGYSITKRANHSGQSYSPYVFGSKWGYFTEISIKDIDVELKS